MTREAFQEGQGRRAERKGLVPFWQNLHRAQVLRGKERGKKSLKGWSGYLVRGSRGWRKSFASLFEKFMREGRVGGGKRGVSGKKKPSGKGPPRSNKNDQYLA